MTYVLKLEFPRVTKILAWWSCTSLASTAVVAENRLHCLQSYTHILHASGASDLSLIPHCASFNTRHTYTHTSFCSYTTSSVQYSTYKHQMEQIFFSSSGLSASKPNSSFYLFNCRLLVVWVFFFFFKCFHLFIFNVVFSQKHNFTNIQSVAFTVVSQS